MNRFTGYYLAPMAELSHRALRELIEGFFAVPPSPSAGPGTVNDGERYRPVYYTEMISAPGLLARGPFEKWYLDSGPCAQRLVYQLVGADGDQLAAAAALLDRRDCLGIDINMGCAAPAITRTGAGIRWMENQDRAGRLIRTLRRITTKRLSVKIRLGPKINGGRDRNPRRFPAEEAGTPAVNGPGELPLWEPLLRFCRRLEEEGADLIALHPRTGEEKFKRRARWDYVERLRGELRIPVAGNGDIASAEEMARKAAAGPVMAGRLAVRRPWVFAQAAGLAEPPGPGPEGFRVEPPGDGAFESPPFTGGADPREETALRFLELLARHQPPEFHLSRARRFFHYYCDNFTWAEFLRNQLNREETLAGMGRIISGHCRSVEGPGPGLPVPPAAAMDGGEGL
ncbi:MAG: tRNA-dihydrouridine synthase family protein [Treponema sp.]|jgi:tRNA-dihydrouridine synthase|nr:tRNA-dihydrouridine synthase family protein [Treponema sp.]